MTDKSGDGAATDVAADLADLRSAIASLGESIAVLMSGCANAAGAAVRGVAGDAREQHSHATGHARNGALGAVADLGRRIERDPLTAVLIAAGLGMAIGMMTKSPR